MLETLSRGQLSDQGFDRVPEAAYRAISLQGGEALWKERRREFCTIFDASCSDFLSYGKIREEQTRLRKEISDSDTTVIILQNHAGNMVGFTYALADLTDNATIQKLLEKDFAGKRMTEAEVLERQKRTAQVGWTVITPAERGKGGWTLMMDALDKSLVDDGRFNEMVRSVRLAGDYANKVASRYKERIVYREPFYSSGRYGAQVYFRVSV